MPRRSSGGRPAPRAAPRPAPVRNPPQPASQAPPPAPVQSSGGMLGGIGSTIAQGMAFGVGSDMGHRAVESIMGPRTVHMDTAPAAQPVASAGASDACDIHNKAFQDCLNNYGSDISKCQFYLDMLSQCRRNSSSISA
ncbi:coiled-coil-helix-coiled-coil-helix domain-containing protein 2 [Amborella trichopoda]|uniref:CHCH domain-containing protein n=1 Tax=Amborella trichopoda TaxID=13333 RepID=U5CMI7_AMBTC|nr:coiled-coil-helix-coiled-coil-helix domain-containing protein 2 [Amborella trichopoda]ERN14356.1 hypothetical protein AMTR_s00033p00217810 [Amborella trichopoda]|eukprot:XP_006852889.1 coiled-coil-helix-coiled-coil-helix domain-containing protein 2 [Amborella trichopoda]